MNIRVKLCSIRCLIAAAAFLAAASPSGAVVPPTIGYQGYLTTTSGTPLNGTRQVTFALYTVASGGTALWTESHPAVEVSDGVFSVTLGSVSSLQAVPFDTQYYLGVNVGGEGEMTPRKPLASVPYALRASSSGAGTAITSLPRTIASPGLYFLTGNLTSTGNGITVNASNVTVEMNGYTITGPGKGVSGYRGVYIPAASEGVQIRNGTVTAFWSGIVDNSGGSCNLGAESHRISNMRVVGTGTGHAIYLLGCGSVVEDCTVTLNDGIGVITDVSVVRRNIVTKNLQRGISGGTSTTVEDNTVSYNGAEGILTGGQAIVRGNNVTSNTGIGVSVGNYSLVMGNLITGNTAGELSSGTGSVAVDNLIY